MNANDKAKIVSAHARDQVEKISEMLESIKAIHGEESCQRMTLIANLMVWESENNILLASLSTHAMMVMPDEMAMKTTLVVGEMIDRSHEFPIALFAKLFPGKEERDELWPFLGQLAECMNSTVDKMEAMRKV